MGTHYRLWYLILCLHVKFENEMCLPKCRQILGIFLVPFHHITSPRKCTCDGAGCGDLENSRVFIVQNFDNNPFHPENWLESSVNQFICNWIFKTQASIKDETLALFSMHTTINGALVFFHFYTCIKFCELSKKSFPIWWINLLIWVCSLDFYRNSILSRECEVSCWKLFQLLSPSYGHTVKGGQKKNHHEFEFQDWKAAFIIQIPK